MAASLAARADLTPEQIKKGQELYTNGCLSCHPKKGGMINPKTYTDAQWGKCMNRMMPLSKLSGDDKKLLGEYLAAARLGKVELPKTGPAAKDEQPAKSGRKAKKK